jgi:hypothetical protein
MEALGFNLRQEAVLQTLTEDVLKSSEIEGEKLDPAQVRSSIARRLGMDIGACRKQGCMPSEEPFVGAAYFVVVSLPSKPLRSRPRQVFTGHRPSRYLAPRRTRHPCPEPGRRAEHQLRPQHKSDVTGYESARGCSADNQDLNGCYLVFGNWEQAFFLGSNFFKLRGQFDGSHLFVSLSRQLPQSYRPGLFQSAHVWI